eukprot:14344152-Alexandrium_andersonii.AAC.1
MFRWTLVVGHCPKIHRKSNQSPPNARRLRPPGPTGEAPPARAGRFCRHHRAQRANWRKTPRTRPP